MECFNLGLMSYPSRIMEAFVTENNLNCVDLAQQGSEKNFSMLDRDSFVVFW